MHIEDGTYENFKMNEINNLKNLEFTFNLNQRFIHVRDLDGNNFSCQTPFLRVLKTNHITLNKKKTIAKKYIILETSDELDVNNQIGDFMFIINKIHEICQENIRENSMEWFNTEFDDIGLDIKVRRPVDQQRESEFIRISIPKNEELESRVNNIQKGEYVLCNIIFKGMKVSNDYIIEEWELSDFITQTQYDEMEKMKLMEEELQKAELITTALEEDENTLIKMTEDVEVSIIDVDRGEYENEVIIKNNDKNEIENNGNNTKLEDELNETIENIETEQNNLNEIKEEIANKEDNKEDNKVVEIIVEDTNLPDLNQNTDITEMTGQTKNSKIHKEKNKHNKHKIIKKAKKIVYF